MGQLTDTTANRNMTEAELDAYFQQILDERAPLNTAAMSTADLEAFVAETAPRVQAGPSLMDCAATLGSLHCTDANAVTRAATYFVSLLIARAYTPAGAR